MIHIVDTHPLVWHLEGNPQLAPAARTVLTDPGADLVVPTVILAEIHHLHYRKKIRASAEEVRAKILLARNCSVYPLDEAVWELFPPDLDIHDAVIVATTRLYRDVLREPVRLIMCDQPLIESGIVDTVW